MENQLRHGFILLNKPGNVSSFFCIKKLKKFLPPKTKIGHTGTLDTFASGLLIICIGRSATKLVNAIQNLDKQYQVTAKLGELTDTLDHTGTILKQNENISVFKENLKKAIESFGNSYQQIAPIYSALKFQGKPLYKLARHGLVERTKLEEIVQSKQRTVTLYEMNLISFSPPFFTFTAHVSKGTYVRSLAHDMAQKVGSIATTYELIRTAIGPFTLLNSIPLDQIDSRENMKAHLVEIDKMLHFLQEYISPLIRFIQK